MEKRPSGFLRRRFGSIFSTDFSKISLIPLSRSPPGRTNLALFPQINRAPQLHPRFRSQFEAEQLGVAQPESPPKIGHQTPERDDRRGLPSQKWTHRNGNRWGTRIFLYFNLFPFSRSSVKSKN